MYWNVCNDGFDLSNEACCTSHWICFNSCTLVTILVVTVIMYGGSWWRYLHCSGCIPTTAIAWFESWSINDIVVFTLEYTEQANTAYEAATSLAKTNMTPTNAIRLGLALNYSVFHYEIGNEPDNACKLAKTVSVTINLKVF